MAEIAGRESLLCVDKLVLGVASVLGVLDNDAVALCSLVPPAEADELGGLSREHRAEDDLEHAPGYRHEGKQKVGEILRVNGAYYSLWFFLLCVVLRPSECLSPGFYLAYQGFGAAFMKVY